MNKRYSISCLVALILVIAEAPAALGQGRGFSQVGGPRTVGAFNTSASDFANYSYGLSSIDRPAPATGVLQNNVSTFGLVRPAGMPGGSANSTPPESVMSGSKVMYAPQVTQLRAMGGPGFVAAMRKPADPVKSTLPTGMTMANSFGFVAVEQMDLQKPITSFVPETPGRYADYMRAGEQAMHAGRYDTAADKFAQAGYISGKSPELLLSLAHASCAQGQYTLMSHYVRLALMYFPELPAAKIQMRSFFRDAADFVRSREDLIDRAQASGDAGYWLALAYVQWFDDVPDQAVDALQRAAQASTDPLQMDAIRTFWDGCVATGRVSGALSSQPARAAALAAPTSQPAQPVN